MEKSVNVLLCCHLCALYPAANILVYATFSIPFYLSTQVIGLLKLISTLIHADFTRWCSQSKRADKEREGESLMWVLPVALTSSICQIPMNAFLFAAVIAVTLKFDGLAKLWSFHKMFSLFRQKFHELRSDARVFHDLRNFPPSSNRTTLLFTHAQNIEKKNGKSHFPFASKAIPKRQQFTQILNSEWEWMIWSTYEFSVWCGSRFSVCMPNRLEWKNGNAEKRKRVRNPNPKSWMRPHREERRFRMWSHQMQIKAETEKQYVKMGGGLSCRLRFSFYHSLKFEHICSSFVIVYSLTVLCLA